MTDDPTAEDGLTPAERAAAKRPHDEFLQEIHGWIASGWVWDETRPDTLVKPEDQELSIVFNRTTQEVIYSPKLLRRLGDQIRRLLKVDSGEAARNER